VVVLALRELRRPAQRRGVGIFRAPTVCHVPRACCAGRQSRSATLPTRQAPSPPFRCVRSPSFLQGSFPACGFTGMAARASVSSPVFPFSSFLGVWTSGMRSFERRFIGKKASPSLKQGFYKASRSSAFPAVPMEVMTPQITKRTHLKIQKALLYNMLRILNVPKRTQNEPKIRFIFTIRSGCVRQQAVNGHRQFLNLKMERGSMLREIKTLPIFCNCNCQNVMMPLKLLLCSG
jgi:hypothetical protein